MIGVVVGAVLAVILAVTTYLGRERLGAAGLGLAALRITALVALVAALLNPARTIRREGDSPLVLLDASLSMSAPGGKWSAARDSARALAGAGGAVLRFGAGVAPGDSLPPTDGMSRLGDALRVAAGMDGPVHVITDGEIDDAGSLPPSLRAGVGFSVLPRDTVPGAALADVTVPARPLLGDSVPVRLVIATWGGLPPSSDARIAVYLGERRLHEGAVDVPGSPGSARRTVWLGAGAVPEGEHVLRFVLSVPGDGEARDDERFRVVTVTSRPGIVVLVDPADTEGRFLVRELEGIVAGGVSGFARVQDDRWLDMATATPVAAAEVRAASRAASLVIVRGAPPDDAGGRATWLWPAASGGAAELFEGDWYVTGDLPPSPLAGRLAAVEWDSLPPLRGVVPVVPATGEWVGMAARAGRRGADRPVLVGRDAGDGRSLVTVASGVWRWALRGGASLEGYRTLLAAGVDWLLAGATDGPDRRLTASAVVPQGRPVVFTWRDETAPDSVPVTVAGADTTVTIALRFDAAGEARHVLPPGVYRWSVVADPETRGVMVVETYSDEFQPAPVSVAGGDAASVYALVVRHAREAWWLFPLAVLAFLVEWGWRQRRGLP